MAERTARVHRDGVMSVADGPEGVFVFTILHPAFFSQQIVDDESAGQRYRKVTGYLDHQTRWIGSFGGHRSGIPTMLAISCTHRTA